MTTRLLPDGTLVIEGVDLNQMGPVLRAARQHRKLLGSDMCHLADIPQPNLSFIETGKRQAGRDLIATMLGVLDASVTITVPIPPRG